VVLGLPRPDYIGARNDSVVCLGLPRPDSIGTRNDNGGARQCGGDDNVEATAVAEIHGLRASASA